MTSTAAAALLKPIANAVDPISAEPVKARVLLMLALTRATDPTEIQRMFAEY